MSTPIQDRRIIDYRVIKSDRETENLLDFNCQARKLIEEGFQPYGEPCIKQPPGSFFIQAFVKYYSPPIQIKVEDAYPIIKT